MATYEIVDWKNEEEGDTPINSTNLKRMDLGIKQLYDELDKDKSLLITNDMNEDTKAPYAKVVKEYVDNKLKITSDINDTNENAVPNAKTIKDYASRKVATASISTEIQNFKKGTIALNTIKSNTSLLTLENNGIKIGKGIKKILVSGNVFGNAQEINTSYLWIHIKKNDEIVCNALSNPSSWFTSTVLSPNLIDVQEGDVITLWKEDDVATHIRSKAYTYLTVEVIE